LARPEPRKAVRLGDQERMISVPNRVISTYFASAVPTPSPPTITRLQQDRQQHHEAGAEEAAEASSRARR
jgi:hypothetical protein